MLFALRTAGAGKECPPRTITWLAFWAHVVQPRLVSIPVSPSILRNTLPGRYMMARASTRRSFELGASLLLLVAGRLGQTLALRLLPFHCIPLTASLRPELLWLPSSGQTEFTLVTRQILHVHATTPTKQDICCFHFTHLLQWDTDSQYSCCKATILLFKCTHFSTYV